MGKTGRCIAMRTKKKQINEKIVGLWIRHLMWVEVKGSEPG